MLLVYFLQHSSRRSLLSGFSWSLPVWISFHLKTFCDIIEVICSTGIHIHLHTVGYIWLQVFFTTRPHGEGVFLISACFLQAVAAVWKSHTVYTVQVNTKCQIMKGQGFNVALRLHSVEILTHCLWKSKKQDWEKLASVSSLQRESSTLWGEPPWPSLYCNPVSDPRPQPTG